MRQGNLDVEKKNKLLVRFMQYAAGIQLYIRIAPWPLTFFLSLHIREHSLQAERVIIYSQRKADGSRKQISDPLSAFPDKKTLDLGADDKFPRCPWKVVRAGQYFLCPCIYIYIYTYIRVHTDPWMRERAAVAHRTSHKRRRARKSDPIEGSFRYGRNW